MLILDIHFNWPGMLWMIGGMVGLIVRIRLYQKFREDIAVQPRTLNGFRRSISCRSIESTRIHVLIKAGIVLIGFSTMLLPQAPSGVQPTAFGIFITVFLTAMPFALTFDALREYGHQKWMLAYGVVLANKEHRQQETTDFQVKRGDAQDLTADVQTARGQALDVRAEGLEQHGA